MPKATKPDGLLNGIRNCYLDIPNFRRITLYNLPDISDSKSVVYNPDGIIGRASPLHTYSYSDTRTISIQFHYFVLEQRDIENNLAEKRAIESCAYPREGRNSAPFKPPVICRFRCGSLLTKNEDLCISLQQYSIKYPTDVAWDEETLCPYKFDIDTTWMVVYTSEHLPYASRVIRSGR